MQCRAILVNVIRLNDDNNSINSINRQLKRERAKEGEKKRERERERRKRLGSVNAIVNNR